MLYARVTNTGDFCEFYNTCVPVLGTSASRVRSLPGTPATSVIYPRSPAFIQIQRPERSMRDGVILVSHTNRTPNSNTYPKLIAPVHVSFVSERTQ